MIVETPEGVPGCSLFTPAPRSDRTQRITQLSVVVWRAALEAGGFSTFAFRLHNLEAWMMVSGKYLLNTFAILGTDVSLIQTSILWMKEVP